MTVYPLPRDNSPGPNKMIEKRLLSVIVSLMGKILVSLLLVFCPCMLSGAGQADKATNKEAVVESFFQKGVTFYIQRDFQSATTEWQRVLELEPAHQKAKIYFERAYEKYQDMEKNFYFGLDSYKKGECQPAVDYLKKTLLINPRHKKALYYIQLAYDCLQVRVVIQEEPSAGAKKTGAMNLSTDREITLYAAGYDGSGNFIGPVDVLWKSTGTLDPITNREKSSAIKFAPSTFDTSGTIVAELDEKTRAETGKLKVEMGKLAAVRILDGSFGLGEPVKKIEMTADDTVQLYAAGYDRNGNFIGDVPVDWKTEGDLQALEAGNTSAFLFQPVKAASGRIVVKARNGFVAVLSNVIVRPGKLDYVQIEYGPERDNREVYSLNLTTDETAVFYSAGYDRNNNRIGSVKCDWETTQTLDPVALADADRFTFMPRKAKSRGTVRIRKKNAQGDETGLITILPGKAQFIAIVSSPLSNADVLNGLAVRAGEEISLYAAGFGASKNMLGLYEADWKVRSTDFSTNLMKKNRFRMTLTGAPRRLRIDLSHSKIRAQTNFLLDILPDAARRLHVSDVPGRAVEDKIVVRADAPRKFYAFFTDRFGNIIEGPCVWSLKDLSGSLSGEESQENLFTPDRTGEGEIRALSRDIPRGASERLSGAARVKVVPGALRDLALYRGTERIEKDLALSPAKRYTLFSRGLDGSGNVISNISCEWSAEDPKTNFFSGVQGSSLAVYFARPVTNGVISLKNGDLRKDVSFTVVPGEAALIVEAETQRMVSRTESENLVNYYVYNGDTLSLIISRILQLPYVWNRVRPFILAVADYNGINDTDLIFPRQRIKVPYFTIESDTTKEDLALKIFGSRDKKDMIKIFNKPGEAVSAGDRLFLINEEFLRTGNLVFTNTLVK